MHLILIRGPSICALCLILVVWQWKQLLTQFWNWNAMDVTLFCPLRWERLYYRPLRIEVSLCGGLNFARSEFRPYTRARRQLPRDARDKWVKITGPIVLGNRSAFCHSNGPSKIGDRPPRSSPARPNNGPRFGPRGGPADSHLRGTTVI